MFDHQFHLISSRESISAFNKQLKFTGKGTDFMQGVEGILKEIKQSDPSNECILIILTDGIG